MEQAAMRVAVCAVSIVLGSGVEACLGPVLAAGVQGPGHQRPRAPQQLQAGPPLVARGFVIGSEVTVPAVDGQVDEKRERVHAGHQRLPDARTPVDPANE